MDQKRNDGDAKRDADALAAGATSSIFCARLTSNGLAEEPCERRLAVRDDVRLSSLLLVVRRLCQRRDDLGQHAGVSVPPKALRNGRQAVTRQDCRTLPSVVSDLLMLAPSLSRAPRAPVAEARSLPARSTRLTLLT